MPDTGYHPDNYPANYCFEHRLADGSTYRDLPPEHPDSIPAILQRLADFPLPEDESEDK